MDQNHLQSFFSISSQAQKVLFLVLFIIGFWFFYDLTGAVVNCALYVVLVAEQKNFFEPFFDSKKSQIIVISGIVFFNRS
jgi:hypothetical protein